MKESFRKKVVVALPIEEDTLEEVATVAHSMLNWDADDRKLMTRLKKLVFNIQERTYETL